MGFPAIYYFSLLPKPLSILLYFFDRIKLAVSLSMAYIGLSSRVEDRGVVDVELDLYLLPSLSKESPSEIKSALRVVEFASFCRGSAGDAADLCAVCMGELEARDEVRELGRCSHAFHKGCIDRWVDIGQVTCPLCRAKLLPNEREGREAYIL